MFRRDLLKACLAGAALWHGSGCSRRKTSGRQRLRVIASRRLSMSSLYLAHELGYFNDAGFDLEVQQGATPLQSVAAIAGGKADVMFTALTVAFLNAVAKGLELKVVAGREIASPTCGTAGAICGSSLTFPNGLADVRQLKGKRVAAGPSIGFSQFAVDAQLESAGLSAKDITPVTLSSAEAIAALVGGSIDAMVQHNDFERDLTSLASGVVRTPGLAQVHPNFQYSHIYFGNTLLSADVEIGARFLGAYLRGVRDFALGKSPRFMEEFATSNGLDAGEIKRVCRGTFTLDGAIDKQSLKLFAEWAYRGQYTPRVLNVPEIADSRFLDSAHAI